MEYTEENCRNDTMVHIAMVAKLIEHFMEMLFRRSLDHDKSKLEEPELSTFVEFTPKLKSSTYGSDEYKGFLKSMNVALQHHYHENRHHPEHFPFGIADMNLVDIVEMFCDWIAASKRHDDGDIYQSIEFNGKRFKIPYELISIFKNTAEQVFGEKPK